MKSKTATLAAATVVLMALVAWTWIPNNVQSAFTSPTYATAVTSSTTDFKPSLEGLTDANAYLARWNRGDAADINDDMFYIHFQANANTGDAAAIVTAGDIRIAAGTAVSGLTVFEVVQAGQSDVGQPLISPEADGTFQLFSTYVEYLEMDGFQGYSRSDALILDLVPTPTNCAGAPADGFGICDLRLTAVLSLAAGTMVKSGDADLSEFQDTDGVFPDAADNSASAGAVTLRFFDANENNVLDKGTPADTVYARMATGAPGSFAGPTNYIANVPVVMDLRLTAFSSFAGGTIVAAGNSDVLPIFTAVPASRLVCYPVASCTAGNGLSTDKLLLNFDAAATRVQLGDLILSTAGGTAGSLVTSAATGAGNEFRASATAITSALFYVDLSPVGLGEEDPVYLNRPNDIGGNADAGNGLRVSVNDVRISVPSGGTGTAGDAVASGAADLTSYQNTDGVAIANLKFWDGSRSNTIGALRAMAVNSVRLSGANGAAWAAGEVVYVGASGAAITSPVAAGQIRVNPVAYTEDSAVLCTNSENADCGDTLFAAPGSGSTIRITGGVTNDALFEGTEDAYISSSTTVSNGDVRLTAVGAFAIGSTVVCPGNSDCGTAITIASNACMTGADMSWTTGETAYQMTGGACPATVSGTTLARMGWVALPGATAVASTDPDVGLATVAETAGTFKVTGGDNIWTPGTEWIYVSANHQVADGETDVRVTDVTLNSAPNIASGSTVAAGHADVSLGATTGDALYASAVSFADSKFPIYADVRILPYNGLAFGSRVATGGADYTPRTLAFQAKDVGGTPDNTRCLSRTDRGETGRVNDDAFYVSTDCTAAPLNPTTGDVRLTTVTGLSLATGTIVSGGDADVSATNTVAARFFSQVRYIDGPSSKAGSLYDSGDLVYVEQSLGTAADGALGANDIRLKATTGLSTNYGAGTFVNPGDIDQSTYPGAGVFRSDPDGGGTQVLRGKFIDKDGDAAWDAGEHIIVSSDQAECDVTSCSAILKLADLFLSGTGGTTSTTGVGGGGGTTTPASTLPTLSSAAVNNVCILPSGSLTFTVVYTDSLNRAPSSSNVVFNGVTSTMSGSGTYSSGVTYTGTVTAPSTAGDYAPTFSFANAGGSVSLAGPTVTVMSSSAAAPTLTGGSVSPASGNASGTYTWSVTYRDANNDAPTIMQVLINGVAKDMTSSDTTYCNGAIYTYSQTMDAGTHTYAFKFKDAATEVLLPATGTSAGPTVTTAAATTSTTGTTGTTGSTPTDTTPTTSRGGSPGFGLAAFAAAAVGAVLLLRRRKA